MIDYKGFIAWLKVNTQLSNKSSRDVVSRLKRVDKITPWIDNGMYLYTLYQNETFLRFSVSVKSQCKRAVQLYKQYINEVSKSEGID